MDNKYFYYAVSDKQCYVKRKGVIYRYNIVLEVPCDYQTARAKAEKQRKLINIINDLRRS